MIVAHIATQICCCYASAAHATCRATQAILTCQLQAGATYSIYTPRYHVSTSAQRATVMSLVVYAHTLRVLLGYVVYMLLLRD